MLNIKKPAAPALAAAPDKLTPIEMILLTASSFLTMLFVTCCSPLYSFNYWDDANVYLTLGRGILHGLAPYKDLYEQKGPLVYLVHAVAALISEESFIGVWFIEIVMAVVFAFFAWKTVKLCITPSKSAIVLMPMLISSVYTIGMMNFGDSSEEFSFPFLVIIFYLVLKDSKYEPDRLPSRKSAFIIGLLTSVLFWVKYTFLGPVIGLCILMVIWTIKPRAWKKLGADIGLFLAGFAAFSIPIVIYLVATGSLDDMFTAYIYNNVVYYLDKDLYDFALLRIPVIGKIVLPCLNLYGVCLLFPKYPLFLILCAIGTFCCDKKVRSRAVQIFFVTFTIAILTLLSRQQIMPYYAYITVYAAPMAAITGTFVISLLEKRLKVNDTLILILVSAISITTLAFNIITNKNMYMMKYKKSDYPQYKFAEIIKETPDPNILTYDVMDRGFYLATGTLPKTQYYCYLTIEESWPVILEEQHKQIANHEFDYIITYSNEYEWDGYEVVDSVDIIYTNISGNKVRAMYFLYKKTV